MKKGGKIVETPYGRGTVKNSEQLINGKVAVYLLSGEKILITPDKIKIVGFYD